MQAAAGYDGGRLRVYLNTSAWNRPFDDLSSDRVRLEAEQVAVLLAAAERGSISLVGSEYLDFEIGQNPDPERAQKVQALARMAREKVRASDAVVARARALERFGLRGLDALHIASAEAARADVIVTTDDRMIRTAVRAGARLRVAVVRPAAAVAGLAEEA